ncbi:BAQ_1a_G0037860.mRNA.1.CDS.1 [Saccharomyces cerevisiae]|nr:BAQ_1a_G0037860.mRNA.1.CDS.1 [Saccharomyces cerevisiae]CAI4661955.1 BAM_G0037860.mRNA.1.CDS.1 [Saccharomyces cerevisiae]CAI7242709.1 BAM_G0037860.mRNA.1.CDS.1 [Saccharomyces cerevisiae]CAI7243272.1 BAQ_1a_G0037860.mRNA.1.CDS.1 [Saccharomyces cerevisiae]
MSGFIKSTLLGLGQDYLEDQYQEFAEQHFQPTRDPFYETNKDGKKHRRRLPYYCTKDESKAWKKVQNKAWLHDKSLCGCCCWTNTIGWAPLLALLPVIGPLLMYWVHDKLIELADDRYKLPAEIKVKMHGNIVIDLLISLVPILGSVFAWLHACSTRNAAIVYNFVGKRALERKQAELMHQKEENEKHSNANIAPPVVGGNKNVNGNRNNSKMYNRPPVTAPPAPAYTRSTNGRPQRGYR